MKKIREEQGITLPILIITLVIITILASTVIISTVGVTDVKKLTAMYNDLEILQEKVNNYYEKNKKLPIGNSLTEDIQVILGDQKDANDNNKYYKINLSLLENINLQYGHEKVPADYYIINEQSHRTYYLRGITVQGTTHYAQKKLSTNTSGIDYGISKFELKAQAIERIENNIKKYDIIIKNNIEDASNVAGYKYKINSEPWTDLKTENRYILKNVEKFGIYKISLIVVDKQGNESYAINNGAQVSWKPLVNAPELLGTMQAVYWEKDGTQKVQGDAGFDIYEWYDYQEEPLPTTTGGTSKWANAVTKNSTGQITGYWVWIPRYAYKINGGLGSSSAGIIDIEFINTENINITRKYSTVYPTVSGAGTEIKMNDYYVHPAFTNESTTGYSNGGWDAEIPGFWVAKFPAGFAGVGNNTGIASVDSNVSYTGITAANNIYGSITSGTTKIKYPVFLPKTYAYNNINLGDSYSISKQIATTNAANVYGIQNKDSHLMKNSEWGAIAYLTQSKYGRNGTETTINNVNLNAKPHATINAITGYAGDNIRTTMNTLLTAPATLGDTLIGNKTSYAWDTNNGKLGSSTGNMYGIYDLIGCVGEYTAGYINNNNTTLANCGGILITDSGAGNSTKYKSVYANSTTDTSATNYTQNPNPTRKGEAIWETSTAGNGRTSWNGRISDFPCSTGSGIVRGGNYNSETGAGVFSFNYADGAGNSSIGFRGVLI